MTKFSETLHPDAVAMYASDAECPLIAIRLVGGYSYYESQLHEWRCLLAPGGLLWYCTRCQKTSYRKLPTAPKPRKPRTTT